MLAPSWVHLAAGRTQGRCRRKRARRRWSRRRWRRRWLCSRSGRLLGTTAAMLPPSRSSLTRAATSLDLSCAHRCDASHASALRFSASCGSSPWRARFPCARLARALHVRPEPFCSLKTMTAPGHAAAMSDTGPTSVDAWRDPTSPLVANSAHSGRSHLLRAPLALETSCQRHLCERLHAPSLLPGAQVLPVLRPLALQEGPLSGSPLVVGSPARSNPRTPLAHKSTHCGRNRVHCLRSACCGACASERKNECKRHRFQKERMDESIYIYGRHRIYIYIRRLTTVQQNHRAGGSCAWIETQLQPRIFVHHP